MDGSDPYREPLPPEARPLATTTRWWACAASMAADAPPLVRRRPRTPARSRTEYERRWAGQRAAARWRRATDLEGALGLSSYGDRPLHALLEFRAYALPAPAFFRWRARKLVRVLGAHHPPGTPVAEVGCGAGKNLQVLAWAGYRDLVGTDVSPSALVAVRDWAALFDVPVRTHALDLLAPDRSVLDRLENRVLLTNHVLEQMPRSLPTAIGTLAACRPREVVHIEPCAELLRPARHCTDLATAVHLRAQDYQRSLLTELRAWERRGHLRILEVRPLGYAPLLRNAPALIRWCPA
jgi:SAM-dependent methyltransferase